MNENTSTRTSGGTDVPANRPSAPTERRQILMLGSPGRTSPSTLSPNVSDGNAISVAASMNPGIIRSCQLPFMSGMSEIDQKPKPQPRNVVTLRSSRSSAVNYGVIEVLRAHPAWRVTRPKMRFLSTGSATIRCFNFTHNLTHNNRVLVIPCSDLAAPERI
jgi:hypothetical protein